METRANHVLIGAFTVLIVACAALFVMWIGKLGADREFDQYLVVFDEAVTGLSVGGPVHFSGIQVGEVTRLKLDPSMPGRVLAEIRVSGGTPVRRDTVAKLGFLGLTGVAFIQLSGGSPQAGPPLANGEELPVIRSEASDLQRLLAGSEDIVTSVNEVLFRLSLLLSQSNLDAIGQTLGHVEQIAATIASQGETIGRAIEETAAASAKLTATLDRVDGLIASLDRFAVTTEALLDGEGRQVLLEARDGLAALRGLIELGETVIGDNREPIASFTRQSLAEANASIAELRELLRALTRVTERLESDPSGFLLGREQPKEFIP